MNREQRIRELQTCSLLVEVYQFHSESAQHTFAATQDTPLSFCGICGKDRQIGCRHHDDGLLVQIHTANLQEWLTRHQNVRVVDERTRLEFMQDEFPGKEKEQASGTEADAAV